MKNIEINTTPNQDELESFEKDEKNIIQVRIQLPTGEMIDSSKYRVELTLSKAAMLGLATNLIRFVHNADSPYGFWHLHPSEPNLASQILGVYLHPGSCELLVSEKDLGCLDAVSD
jgi:hypothetical protein